MSAAVVCCENCETWFCLICDEEGGACDQCGRTYCGDCRGRGEVCLCPPAES